MSLMCLVPWPANTRPGSPLTLQKRFHPTTFSQNIHKWDNQCSPYFYESVAGRNTWRRPKADAEGCRGSGGSGVCGV